MKNEIFSSLLTLGLLTSGLALAGSADDVDSLGCGDGVKTAPNGWFVAIAQDDPNMFKETSLISVNSFRITSVIGWVPPGDSCCSDIIDVSKINKIYYVVSFTPGVDSTAFPTAREDTIKNRDDVLLNLKNLGAEVECNHIVRKSNVPQSPAK